MADPLTAEELAAIAEHEAEFAKTEHGADVWRAMAAKLQAAHELADAVWQVLDDMGLDGKACCGAAKAQLRVAYEPFRQSDDELAYPLATAQATLQEADY